MMSIFRKKYKLCKNFIITKTKYRKKENFHLKLANQSCFENHLKNIFQPHRFFFLKRASFTSAFSWFLKSIINF